MLYGLKGSVHSFWPVDSPEAVNVATVDPTRQYRYWVPLPLLSESLIANINLPLPWVNTSAATTSPLFQPNASSGEYL